MPAEELTELRIHCVCGQKMKVGPAMFGKPGKCVACSQKIRVPMPEDLAPGTTEIFLKDHPEFLRKASAPAESVAEDEAGEVALAAETDRADIAPIDPLPAVTRLCSYEFKLNRMLEQYRDAPPHTPRARERTKLMGYRALARKARGHLEERMRQRLLAVANELTSLKEEIARAGLAARVGEYGYWEYRDAAAPLRRRREQLERLRHNLRGWLAVQNPYVAGGYEEVALDDPPAFDPDLAFPDNQPGGAGPLLSQLISGLRDAFSLFEEAGARLAEYERARRGPAPREDTPFRAQAEADLERAKAGIAFHRERLMQSLGDRDNEVKAIKAQLDLARERLLTGALDRNRFSQLEIDLLRAQNDAIRARDLARRAIGANTLADVPLLETTLLRRMGQKPGAGAGVDSWFAWGAALTLVIAMFLPVIDPAAGGNVVALQGLMMGLVGTAVLLSLFAAIPNDRLRGSALGVLWLCAATGLALYLHGKYYSFERAGELMRADGRLWQHSGMIALMLALLLMAAAFCIPLIRDRRLRWAPPALLGAGVLFAAAIGTNLGGYLNPAPRLAGVTATPVTRDSEAPPGHYRARVTLTNDGYRSYSVNPPASAHPPYPADLAVRHAGDADGRMVIAPERVQYGGGSWESVLARRTEIVAPAQEVTWEFVLPPGRYEAALTGSWFSARSEPFVLQPLDSAPLPRAAAMPAQAGPGEAVEEAEGEVPAGDETGLEPEGEPLALLEPSTPEAPVVLVELRGVGGDPEAGLSFVLSLTMPGGAPQSMRVKLGERVFREWEALEYDPERGALTIGIRAEEGHIPHRMRVVSRGDSVTIPIE